MTHSTSIATLAAALVVMQSKLKPAKRSGVNEQYDHQYSTLEDVTQAVRQLLAKNGLSYVQSTEWPWADVSSTQHQSAARVRTLLMHTSGEWILTDCSAPSLPHADAHAAECTRLRRRALAALLGVVQDDSDGQVRKQVTYQGRLTGDVIAHSWKPEDAMRAFNEFSRLKLSIGQIRVICNGHADVAEAIQAAEKLAGFQ